MFGACANKNILINLKCKLDYIYKYYLTCGKYINNLIKTWAGMLLKIQHFKKIKVKIFNDAKNIIGRGM